MYNYSLNFENWHEHISLCPATKKLVLLSPYFVKLWSLLIHVNIYFLNNFNITTGKPIHSVQINHICLLCHILTAMAQCSIMKRCSRSIKMYSVKHSPEVIYIQYLYMSFTNIYHCIQYTCTYLQTNQWHSISMLWKKNCTHGFKL